MNRQFVFRSIKTAYTTALIVITPEKKMQELKTSSSICCRTAPAPSPRSKVS